MRRLTLEQLPPPPPHKTGWPWTEECPQLLKAMPDGRPWPRMSIVTPSFNQGDFIEKTIRSVLLQGFPNLEYVIIDGGSTDNSVEIIQEYSPWLSHWVSEPDRGQSAAINKGFTYATGDLLAWLNSDDYYMPGALQTIAKTATANPEASVFVGSARIVDRKGEIISDKEPPAEIDLESLYNWMNRRDFMQPSCFFRKAAWEAGGPLDENLHLALDLDLWLRLAKRACTFMSLRELLSTAVIHDGAKTAAFADLSNVNAAIVIIRHGGEHAARPHLERMARTLAWCEPNMERILRNRLFRILYPLIRPFIKPAASGKDLLPPWSSPDRSDLKGSQ